MTPRCRYYNELPFLKDILTTSTFSNNNLVNTNVFGDSTIGVDDHSSIVVDINQDDLSPILDCNMPSTKPTAEKVPKCPIKRRKKEIDPVDKLRIDALSNNKANFDKPNDADTHFFLSLVEFLKSMPPKHNLIVKSQIMTIVSESVSE